MSRHLCGHAEPGTYTGQVILVAPDFLKHKWPNGIGIDVCLALEIQTLWQAGIQTNGHCCGHGRSAAYISVWPEFSDTMKALGYKPLMHRYGDDTHFVPKTVLDDPESAVEIARRIARREPLPKDTSRFKKLAEDS